MALRKLQTEYPTIEAVQCDITARSNVLALVETIRDRYGMLDVLVNNAGIMERVDLLEESVSDERIAHEIAVNLTGPILLTRRLLPLLRSGRSPMIVMVTSGYALLPATRAPTYSATKAGLRSFTLALRRQLHGVGIRVVEVPATTGRYSCNAHGQQSEDVAGGAGRSGHARHLAWQGRDNAGQGSPTADAYASGSVAHSTPCCRIMRHLSPRCPINGPWRILAACRPHHLRQVSALLRRSGWRRAMTGMGGFRPAPSGIDAANPDIRFAGQSWPKQSVCFG